VWWVADKPILNALFTRSHTEVSVSSQFVAKPQHKRMTVERELGGLDLDGQAFAAGSGQSAFNRRTVGSGAVTGRFVEETRDLSA
jgi:hypothetical protein